MEMSSSYIPFSRRLETAAVMAFLFVFLALGPMALLVLFGLPLYTGWWWLTAVYSVFWLWDLAICSRGGRSGWFVTWTRNWRLWRHYINYFPVTVVKTAPLPPDQRYLFCSHPHGVLCFGAFGAFATDSSNFQQLFPGISCRLLSLEGNFWMPAFRELFLGTGACASSKRSIQAILQDKLGIVPVLVVGGIPEIANFQSDKTVLVLKKRKGFIKLALQHGASLVPCFTFGEAELYDQTSGIGRSNSCIQQQLNRLVGFSPVLFTGRGVFQRSFGILPRRVPLTVVVGEPLTVQKVENPTAEDVDKLQNQYIDRVKNVYQEFNPLYGNINRKLVIT